MQSVYIRVTAFEFTDLFNGRMHHAPLHIFSRRRSRKSADFNIPKSVIGEMRLINFFSLPF
jgi:hypothetical protein